MSDPCTFSYLLEEDKPVYITDGFTQNYATEVADEVCNKGSHGK